MAITFPPEYLSNLTKEENTIIRVLHAAASKPRRIIRLRHPTPTAAVKTTFPVFCTAGSHALKKGIMKVEDFAEFIGLNYGVDQELGTAFNTKTEKEFKAWLKTQHRDDNDEKITGNTASKIYRALKMPTDNIGKKIVVAVAGSCGGGLEIREVTGPYRFASVGVRYAPDGVGYKHQFPTKFVRKLTAEESKAVNDARLAKNCYALTWTVDL
jgi:hypothetical protein